MPRGPLVRLINNWLHDTGTGLWAASLLVIAVLCAREHDNAHLGPAFRNALGEVQWLVFGLLIIALVAIAVTGVYRLLYWRSETPPEQMKAKRPALIGKHVAFLVLYGGGSVWAYTLVAIA
jgi:hypothetical protein